MKTLRLILPLFALLFIMDGVTASKEVALVMKDGTVGSECQTGTLIVPPSGCGTQNKGKGRCLVQIDATTTAEAFNSDDESCEEALYIQ